MLSRISREELVRMMNMMFYSPLFYAVLAWVLAKYPLRWRVDINVLIVICLGGSIALILVSRPLRWLLLPPGREATGARIVLTCLVLATLGEAMAASGALVVWTGARLQAYVPFFVVSCLYCFDFRVFRLPAIIALWPGE